MIIAPSNFFILITIYIVHLSFFTDNSWQRSCSLVESFISGLKCFIFFPQSLEEEFKIWRLSPILNSLFSSKGKTFYLPSPDVYLLPWTEGSKFKHLDIYNFVKEKNYNKLEITLEQIFYVNIGFTLT